MSKSKTEESRPRVQEARFDEAALASLRRSLSIVPQFYSVIVDPVTKETISGIHRREAAGRAVREYVLPDGMIEGLATKLGVSRDMMVVIIRQHLNIQRQPSKEETGNELLRIARGFEKMGVPKEQIARKVVEVSGLSERRTLELLADEFKRPEKATAGKMGGLRSAAASQQKHVEGLRLQSEWGARARASPQHRGVGRKERLCPRCGCLLRSYACGFLHCINQACGDIRAFSLLRALRVRSPSRSTNRE